jgi:hypothetical protein
MTIERKITSRHGVDSRPLSERLKDAWLPLECCDSLNAASTERKGEHAAEDVSINDLAAATEP